MQIVSIGDNLHEMSEPVFQKNKTKQETYHQSVVYRISPESGNG